MSDNWNDIDQILSDFKKQKEEKEKQEIIDHQREVEALERAKRLMEEEEAKRKEEEERARIEAEREKERLEALKLEAEKREKEEAERKRKEAERLEAERKKEEERKKKEAEKKRREAEKLAEERKKRDEEKRAELKLVEEKRKREEGEKASEKASKDKKADESPADEAKKEDKPKKEKAEKDKPKKEPKPKKEKKNKKKSAEEKSDDEKPADSEKEEQENLIPELEPPKKKKELIDFSADNLEAKARSSSSKKLKKRHIRRKLAKIRRIVLNKYVLAVVIVLLLAVAVSYTVNRSVEQAKISYLDPYHEKYPEVNFPDGILEEYCDTFGQNPQLMGELKIESMGIDMQLDNTTLLPVAQGASYYNFVLELDNPEFEKRYSTIDGYNNADKGIFFTDFTRKYNFEVVGAFYTNTKPEDDNGYVFPYNVTEKMSFESTNQFIDRLNSRFIYEVKALDIKRQDMLLTISCPTDYREGYRFVVVCKEVPEVNPEATAIEKQQVHLTASEYENEEDNPYRFASEWYPEIVVVNENGVEAYQQKTLDDYYTEE